MSKLSAVSREWRLQPGCRRRPRLRLQLGQRHHAPLPKLLSRPGIRLPVCCKNRFQGHQQMLIWPTSTPLVIPEIPRELKRLKRARPLLLQVWLWITNNFPRNQVKVWIVARERRKTGRRASAHLTIMRVGESPKPVLSALLLKRCPSKQVAAEFYRVRTSVVH